MTIKYPAGTRQNNSVQNTIRTGKTTKKALTFGKRGMGLEDEINEANDYYLANRLAVVHKKPTPITIVKVDYQQELQLKLRKHTSSRLRRQIIMGGSTLTQQLVKLSVFSTSSADQTLKRKAQEAWLALRVEKNFTKNEILTFYINKVYMGHGIYGMKTAAEYFYSKPLTELSLPQLALLAGMPQSPTYYDPYLKNNSAAKERRDTVIEAMVKYGAITEKQAKAAIATPVNDGLQDLTTKAENADQNRKVFDAYAKSVILKLRNLDMILLNPV
ncbi:hypothetical protein Pfo_031324 [Paulownia fortunei]|nr:hypothetical protein Pfo_031324 [Paulownia fortunei]